MSSDRARSFIRSEIPSWRLTDTVKDAVEQWNKEVLNKTQLPLDRTANMAHVRLLYSSLYFMHPMPSNRTGTIRSGAKYLNGSAGWQTLWNPEGEFERH